MDKPRHTLLEFPCIFPLKIMGEAHPALTQTVLTIVQNHDPNFDGASMGTRLSSAGRYLSLSCSINAVSQAQLDALYRELTAHPSIKVVL